MKKTVIAALAAAVSMSLLLSGCDQQQSEEGLNKLKALFNAVKPDNLLLKNLQPGVTTEAQIREQMGEPETERNYTDGSKRLEYPRGPAGTNTYMVDLDASGRFVSVTQVLTAANIAKVRPGMTMDEVRRLLGKPTEVAEYRLKKERVWSWHWLEDGVNQDAMFNAHFDPDGIVVTTSRSESIRGGQR
ncbi:MULTISPECIES: outer membrane protein assembly factor BamE domain-containing protein [Caballeronia]|uniref:outer membrane protein assembly factor BamE domain-containing protein n=1 Tax=Caballeronia TaxID=1827195 RepID=UPI0003169768|nr:MULTISPECIES: outer membrane protein assembly factor BamE [unclassified Caballeronia]MCE4542783.1 outer membrane protein assembly factor BamE [Caballeronia sp. PC1]MCE4568161.1 outer membrane protein assembly factor BamE [Caballeronia sp. CLC5]BAO85485.1 lipoprotein, putative [Burkholderia sp. RPE67]BBP95317.1 lipoprotein [Burkholderia sp. SFA1]